MNDYGLNQEQFSAITMNSPVFCRASAGAGKTRCLVSKIRYLIDSGVPSESICAITFTNKAANEMKERLKKYANVSRMQISTIHSMSVRIIKAFIHTTHLKIPFTIYDDGDQLSIMKTIVKARELPGDPYEYLHMLSHHKSEDRTPTDEVGLEIFNQYQEILKKNNACDFDDLLIFARNCLKNDQCRNYFSGKWQHILVDEVQDTSRVQFEIVTLLYTDKTKTMFLVGDENQCAIAGTKILTPTGEVLIESIKKGDLSLSGCGNTNLNKYEITDIFSKYVVDFPVITIETSSGKKLTTTQNHTHFAEFVNFSDKFYTYLMYKEGLGYRVGITGSIRHRGRSLSQHAFKSRLNQERADAVWLLKENENRAQAQFFEQYYSVKYGIPTWVFYANKGYDQEYINNLFNSLDTEVGAKKLLSDLGMFIEHPHHTPRCSCKERRRNFTIYLCGCERRFRNKVGILHRYKQYSHFFSISGSDDSDKKILKDLGLKVRNSKDRRGYRVEGVRAELSEIYEIESKIRKGLQINSLLKGRFSDISLPVIPASHILPNMSIFIFDGGKICTELVTKVIREKYTGYIYDLNVAKVHNFIANGILTHNSVYGWRGAYPQNIDKFVKDYKANICQLTYNYRSCPEVISMANGFQQFGKPMVSKSGIIGKVSVTVFNSQQDEADQIAQAIMKLGNYDDTAVIYRINTRSLLFEQTFSRYRIPYKVVNELGFFQRKVCKDLLSALKAANNENDRESLCRVINNPKRGFGEAKKEQLLMHGRQYAEEISKEMPQIRTFLDLLNEIKGAPPAYALERYLNGTGYMSTIEKDSDRYMIDSLRDAVVEYDSVDDLILASTFLERDSEKGINLITAHGSKGLEFEKVFVVGIENELWPHKNSLDLAEESRLYYVACTRAKRYLNISYSQSRMYRGTSITTLPSHLFRQSYKQIYGRDY